MTEILEVYKCEICGNIVEMLHEGAGQLVCCGEPMKLFEAKTGDEGMEKHVPVVVMVDQGMKVKVGDVPHPMLDEHHIEWIEVIVDSRTHRKFLKPGDPPEAKFWITGDNVTVRAYCNIHGLWKSGSE